MDNINDFYNSILNIKDKNSEQEISRIVFEEKNKLLKQTSDLSGYCKFLSNNIKERLNKRNIKSYLIDLKGIVNIDHTILIAEYKYNKEINRILIDPSFIQFVKRYNLELINLKKWPSEKINDYKIVKELTTNGFINIDNKLFNDYLNSFSLKNLQVDINEFLLDLKLESVSKKI